ncbi:hypothetical protein [Phenylobacterium montanum]|uniref:Uncharacterized protein n=1 Tax=Phenylobacterium montanum TaxID=2823693 RepID=A0A975FWK0_9CAUL|nr:hypothetical protein [Caulobacter sp. S6]QUD86257.1 hypothetical protein KCG34_14235 [Caulobacter sp. S6]
MKTIRNLFVALVVLGLIGGGLYGWWALDLRWRPHVITKNQAEIGKLLQGAGWVSPGLSGPKLYLITYRDSFDGTRYQESEFARLQAKGVDTRVIVVARPDLNGQPKSTPAERSTVAEIWVNRGWDLYQKWNAAPTDSWPAKGIPAADGDVARSAVVEVGRDLVERLTPLLKRSGVRFDYPTLVWWAKDGTMKAVSGAKPQTYGAIRKDLGAE